MFGRKAQSYRGIYTDDPVPIKEIEEALQEEKTIDLILSQKSKKKVYMYSNKVSVVLRYLSYCFRISQLGVQFILIYPP
jgi:hypothetical protein